MPASVQRETHGRHTVYLLSDEEAGSSARILADYGFNCYSFQVPLAGRPAELLWAAPGFAERPENPTASGIPLLFPFPNRIRGGRFSFAGRDFELALNHNGQHAIHGLVSNRPWANCDSGVSADGTPFLSAQFRASRDAPELVRLWPADFRIQVTYRLRGSTLSAAIELSNPDDRPLPCGFGLHPYFRLPLRPGADPRRCSVRVPAGCFWELEACLPTGRLLPVTGRLDLRSPRALADETFDDVFSALAFEGPSCTAEVADPDGWPRLRLHFDRMFRELVVYTPGSRQAVCLEPYTCVTDAVNLQPRGVDAGLLVIEPGQTVRGSFSIELVPGA